MRHLSIRRSLQALALFASLLFGLPALAQLALPGITSSVSSKPEPAQNPDQSASQLADLLENEQARKALIEQLRKSAAEPEPETHRSVDTILASAPLRLANTVQSTIRDTLEEARAAIQALDDTRLNILDIGIARFMADLARFCLLILAVLAVYWTLTYLAQRIYRRLNTWSLSTLQPKLSRRASAITVAVLVHAAAITIPWLLGHGISTLLTDETLRQGIVLFLNAFVLVEGIRLVIGAFLARRHIGLRIVPTDDETAAYWHVWTTRMAHFLGYGLLLVTPIMSFALSPAVGRMFAVLLMFIALLNAIVIVKQNRERARNALETLARERTQTSFSRLCLRLLAHTWHLLATLYLCALFIAASFQTEALDFMLIATLKSCTAMLAGAALAALLTRVIFHRISLPEETRRHIPLLETRLNAYVPSMLKVVRLTILLVVFALILDAWTHFDLIGWLHSDSGAVVIGRLFSTALFIGFAALVWLVSASWIEYRLNPLAGHGEPSARVKTLLSLFRNALATVLVIVTVMVVLSEMGVNIAPLLAGAGVLGLAIGFGAQKLVQDVITGLFIQLESVINVGDVVTAAGITGTVERLTIRSVGIRDLAGVFHMIPFSSVDLVSNAAYDFSYHLGIYRVAYREDTDEVVERLKAAFEELRADETHARDILADIEVDGLVELADNSVNIRVRIKTRPGQQFPVGRAYNRLVKRHFDAAGIEIPFPHTTVYFGQNKEGLASPPPTPDPDKA